MYTCIHACQTILGFEIRDCKFILGFGNFRKAVRLALTTSVWICALFEELGQRLQLYLAFLRCSMILGSEPANQNEICFCMCFS